MFFTLLINYCFICTTIKLIFIDKNLMEESRKDNFRNLRKVVEISFSFASTAGIRITGDEGNGPDVFQDAMFSILNRRNI